jgi:hypothetical protein
MTSREATKIGMKMMRLLDMGEWFEEGKKSRIKFQVYRKSDMTDDGNSDWHSEERTANVWVNHSMDDYERACTTILHELLHIVIEGHKPWCGKYDVQYEFALNRLATALWKQWRPLFITT